MDSLNSFAPKHKKSLLKQALFCFSCFIESVSMVSGYIEFGYQSLAYKMYNADSGQIHILTESAFLGSDHLTVCVIQAHRYAGIYFKHQRINRFMLVLREVLDTGSKMDDVVYEEFKGTGNMEMVLDRKVAERRVFPAIDIPQSGTRRDDLLLNAEELEAINNIRRAFNGMKAEEAVDKVVDMFNKTKNNREFIEMVKKIKFF